MRVDLLKFERALDRAVLHINTPEAWEPYDMSTDIKRFADQFRTIKAGIETKMAQANAKLGTAMNTFGASVDKAMAYIDNINQYSSELEGLTRELTNGGPALDDTFSAPAASAAAPIGAPTDHDPNALIAAQKQLGRQHPSQG